MYHRKDFLEKATELTKPHIGKRTAFWFNIDFVEFKLLNYHYGLEKGNQLLAEMEAFLNEAPEITLSQRNFSDEFVFLVITEIPHDDEDMIAMGNSYMYAFLESQQKNYPLCNLELSCGISPVFSDSPIDDMDNAAIARKQSRESDDITAVMFTQAMLEEAEAYRKLEREIALTMHERRVVFDLQPKVNVQTGEIVGAEALARQLAPDGSRIYPNIFMAVMEENGTVVDLDFMILEKVCEYIAGRLDNNLPVVCTSVNLSRLHLHNPSTAALLDAIVQKHGIPQELLEFELTESVFLDELAGAKELMEQLHEYGYLTSIDDFGSGYAGLNLCQEVDFDIIKLDRKFLTDDPRIKKKNEAIIPCIIDMMHRMNIDVICEGVERPDQYEFLLQSGCSIVQGYYFSKPVPPDDFYRIYQEQNGHYPIERS